MSGEEIVAPASIWALVAIVTAVARIGDTGDGSGSIAAGVLWPIYLPYRLFLIVWSLKP